jgi:hypothetical protein
MTQREFFYTPKDSYPSAHTDESAFKGKTADSALIGPQLITGLMEVLSCVTGGGAIYCLPLIPIGLGISALLMKRNAVDTDRTPACGLWPGWDQAGHHRAGPVEPDLLRGDDRWLAASTNGY